jgi:hypothetical protein
MEDYTYHHDDMDKDNRPPACYQLTYRGCRYWSCYRIHLREWFEDMLSVQPIFNRRG